MRESGIRSLVTGAAGFIGSHVVDELLGLGHRVVALDDLSGGVRDNVAVDAEFIQGSILDVGLVKDLFDQHRFTYVYHLAAYAAEGLSHFIKRFNYNNNLIGTINLINAAVNTRSVKCFVYTSSIAVYGAAQVPMKEDMTPLPEDPYGIAKYAAEMDLAEAKRMFDLNSIIFRPHNVYGERQNIGDPYRNVIGIFMNRILRGEPMTIFGDGQQTRAFSYITDVAPIIARCVENEAAYNQVFNVGADKPCSVMDLAHMIAEALGVDADIVHLDARNEVVHAFSSHEKVSSMFPGLVKNVTVREGIQRMAEWVRRFGSRKGQAFQGVEVKENMPPSWMALIDD